jgi:hypothetical protein
MLGIQLRMEQAAVEQNRQDAYFSFANTWMYCQNGSLAHEKRRIRNSLGRLSFAYFYS